MQILEIAVSGTLDGVTPLSQADLGPAPSEPGRNIYTVIDLGYVDPFIAGARNEKKEGVRMDLIHVTQGAPAVAFLCEIVDTQNNPITGDILDLSLGTNLSFLSREIVIPRGYRLRLSSDQAGPFSVKVGFTPLIDPVDFAITEIVTPPT